MRIVFVADGRSPIAVQWISHFVEHGHEVHLLSTFHCAPALELASLTFIPVAFSQWIRTRGDMGQRAPAGHPRGFGAGSWLRSAGWVGIRTRLRQWLGPLTVPVAARAASDVVARIQPDIIHALRIPFEGMLAAHADLPAPLVCSVWGNDFTLHASASPGMARLTRATLGRASGLHTDTERDLHLASDWGYPADRPSVVLPTGGGVRAEVFHPGKTDRSRLDDSLVKILGSIPASAPVVVNPRGFRAYVRNDTFFQSIPAILEQIPDARFLCPAMQGQDQAQRWIRRLDIEAAVSLLPKLTPHELAAVYQRAMVTVSISEHDGTPNTFLEAMACGSYPVVGDIESMREWRSHGISSTLVPPHDHVALASAVVSALTDDAGRMSASEVNRRLVAERAERHAVMTNAEGFYQQVRASL
jgi:glycosyltransferase involved in cell wall biosynthesis